MTSAYQRPPWKPGDALNAPQGPVRSIDPSSQSIADIYKLLIGAIIPRPIAFVSTIGASGAVNVAPFSFFNGVCSNPPCLMISIARKPDGSKKDTLRNIEETKQFVVNSANEWLAEALVYCGAEFPYGVDEMSKVGLSAAPSTRVKPPRVMESALQFECEALQMVPIGDGGAGSSTLVIGKIIYVHALEAVFSGDKLDPLKLNPLARLGGNRYALIGDTFEQPIPGVDTHENFVVRPARK